MSARKRHHYTPWSQDRTNLQGLARVTIQPGESHSKCAACQICVKVGRTGGVKFWVGGKWTTKNPGCSERIS